MNVTRSSDAIVVGAGIVGAAWATLLAYAAMAAMLYVIVQRVYPVDYEWRRIGKIVISLAAVYAAFLLARGAGLAAGAMLFVKFLLVACFVLAIWGLRFFEPRELGFLGDFARRLRFGSVPPGPQDPASGAESEI